MFNEDELKTFWNTLSDYQQQFIIERLSTKTDAEACRRIGIAQSTVAQWADKRMIDDFISYQRGETLRSAKFVLQVAAMDAVDVLRRALKGRQRLTAAKEILDRAGLPAITRQEISGVNAGPIEVKAVDYRNGITNLAPRSVSDSDTSGEV